MSRLNIISLAVAFIAVLGIFGLAVSRAQLTSLVGPEQEALIYDGDLQTDSGDIKITSWGSGKAESVSDQHYVGPEVLKVTSQSPFQGIVLHLTHPLPLDEFMSSGAGHLELKILPARVPTPKEEEQTGEERGRRTQAGRGSARGGQTGGRGMRGGGGGGMQGGGGMRGGGGMMGGGGMRGGGGRGFSRPPEISEPGMRIAKGNPKRSYEFILTGMMGGGGMRGGGGGMMGGGGMRGGGGTGGTQQRSSRTSSRRRGQRETATPARPATEPTGEKAFTLQRLRLVLFTDAGTMSAQSSPVSLIPKDERGWIPVSASLAAFRGAEGGKSLHAVGIFADRSDVFYLGQVRLVVDRIPARLTLNAKPAVTIVNRVIEFSVELRKGDVNPRFFWDFDKSDGIQEQALGSTAKYLYKKPGDYLVTCTMMDRDAVRPPVVSTIGVHIEEAK